MSNKVDDYLKRIHETQIVLPQTKIAKASQLTGAVEISKNGIKSITDIEKVDKNFAEKLIKVFSEMYAETDNIMKCS